MEKLFIILSSKDSDRYKNFESLLNETGWVVKYLKNIGSVESLEAGRSWKAVCLIILDLGNSVLERNELIGHLVNFYKRGGNLIITPSNGPEQERGEEGKTSVKTLNKFLINFRIRFNDDCVVRPNLYKHYHPKEVLMQDFSANRAAIKIVERHLKRKPKFGDPKPAALSQQLSAELNYVFEPERGAKILYPFGCTLEVMDKKIATVLLTTGKFSIPSGQATCALHRRTFKNEREQRLLAFGASSMFEDNYLCKEDNRILIESLVDFVSEPSFSINQSDARTLELPVYQNCLPNLEKLTEKPISVFEEYGAIPKNRLDLIDRKLFNIDCSMLPEIQQAFRSLNVSYGPLTLIKPKLLYYRMALEPATFNFLIRK